jgi:hypothetical protein
MEDDDSFLPEEELIMPNVESYETQNFYISRHLRSCNNIVDDLKLNVLKKIAEPSLSLWGTLTGLSLTRDLKGRYNDRVYVSCLLRTWITAIIEYLPHSRNNTITLVVSPYIKEKHAKGVASYADWGNFPADFKTQINKLIHFFEFLKLINYFLRDAKGDKISPMTPTASGIASSDNEVIQKSSVTEKIKYNLDRILSNSTSIIIEFKNDETFKNNQTFELTNNSGKLRLIDSTPIPRNFEPYFSKSYKDLEVSLEKGTVSLGGAVNNSIKTYLKDNFIALINQKNQKQKINDFELIESEPLDIVLKKIKGKKINPYTNYFGSEGVFLFIDWIKNSIHDDSPDIYVVGHSQIMQDTLIKICNSKNDTNLTKHTLGECHPDLSAVKKQNIWEMILSININTNSNTDDKKLILEKLLIREGEDSPNASSARAMNLNNELSCSNNPIELPTQQQQQTQQQQLPEKQGFFSKMKNWVGINGGTHRRRRMKIHLTKRRLTKRHLTKRKKTRRHRHKRRTQKK